MKKIYQDTATAWSELLIPKQQMKYESFRRMSVKEKALVLLETAERIASKAQLERASKVEVVVQKADLTTEELLDAALLNLSIIDEL